MINVYPDWERLVALSAKCAGRMHGLVYPRNAPMVRLVVAVMNVSLSLRGKMVRAHTRPADVVARITREQGLAPHVSRNVGPWQVAVFLRTDTS